MSVLKSWQLTKGETTCTIGILERDFDAKHPDLRGRIQEILKLEEMLYETTSRSIIHGTEIVGLIAAKEDNGIGVVGLAPNCNVIVALYGMPARNGESINVYRRQYENVTAEARDKLLRRLVNKGCKVINCSFLLGACPDTIFDYAFKNDVVIVLAAGNNNMEVSRYTKFPPNVLIVGGISRTGERWEETFGFIGSKVQGSNYGSSLDVVAPIEDLVVCHPTNVKYKKGRITYTRSRTPVYIVCNPYGYFARRTD